MTDYSKPGIRNTRFYEGYKLRTISFNPSQVPTGSAPNLSWSIYFQSGTFTRASSGSFLTKAPTDGSSAFLSFTGSNGLRIEDRGDGLLTLFEGTRTNLVDISRGFTGGSWSAGTATVTQNDVQGPDNLLSGTRFSASAAGAFSNFESISTTPNTRVAVSTWARAKLGTSTIPLAYESSTTDGIAALFSLTTTYKRIDVEITGGGKFFILDGRDTSAIGGASTSFDGDVDFAQVEQAPFPSSVIWTSGSSVARAADVLTIPSGTLDPRLFNSIAQFDQISPVFSNVDLISSSLGIVGPTQNFEYWLLNFSSSFLDGIRIIYDGTKVIAQVVSQSSVLATSSNLIFNRHALLGPIVWNPANGSLTFSGSTFQSSSWTWPNTNIRIGGIYGRLSESFCRIGNLKNG